jgi:hypothetical protein
MAVTTFRPYTNTAKRIAMLLLQGNCKQKKMPLLHSMNTSRGNDNNNHHEETRTIDDMTTRTLDMTTFLMENTMGLIAMIPIITMLYLKQVPLLHQQRKQIGIEESRERCTLSQSLPSKSWHTLYLTGRYHMQNLMMNNSLAD